MSPGGVPVTSTAQVEVCFWRAQDFPAQTTNWRQQAIKWIQTKRLHKAVVAGLLAGLLAACGGDDNGINRVVVAGDSLADAGTFGLKFTVQNAADPANGFPQLVAQELGVTTGQCNYYRFASGTFITNTT